MRHLLSTIVAIASGAMLYSLTNAIPVIVRSCFVFSKKLYSWYSLYDRCMRGLWPAGSRTGFKQGWTMKWMILKFNLRPRVLLTVLHGSQFVLFHIVSTDNNSLYRGLSRLHGATRLPTKPGYDEPTSNWPTYMNDQNLGEGSRVSDATHRQKMPVSNCIHGDIHYRYWGRCLSRAIFRQG